MTDHDRISYEFAVRQLAWVAERRRAREAMQEIETRSEVEWITAPGEPLGYRAALNVLNRGRSAFFEDRAPDLPRVESPTIAADDLLPQFGFVGERFAERRILFIGINPGNGPHASRNSGDQAVMPSLAAFVSSPTHENFRAAQRAHESVCNGWVIWGQECQRLLDAGGITKAEIAYTNALPWRTASQAGFADYVARRAAALYVAPLMSELAPRIVVAVGKKAATILGYAGHLTDRVVVWNRARAQTPAVIADHERATKRLTLLLGFRH